MSLPRKRLIPACAPGHECTDEEINEIAIEIRDVESDDSIKTYSLPNIAEMKEILDTARKYEGEWYHSSVVIKAREQLSAEQKESEEFMALYNELAADDINEKGIFRSTSYEVDFDFNSLKEKTENSPLWWK